MTVCHIKPQKKKTNFNYITSNFKLPDKYKNREKSRQKRKEDLVINIVFRKN